MVAVTLTRELACASGTDAGNASMRKAGRTRWNGEDFNVAATLTNRLLRQVPYEFGGLGGLPLTADQLADLGIAEAA